MTSTPLTPQEIVHELNRFIVSQESAKKCVANAIRNRWRRSQLPSPLKEEILPKNILMIGPTGVGKTEIARRMARLVKAPFIKVEATKFTEVGYVGRDVEQIIRDLVEVSIFNVRQRLGEEVKEAAEKQVDQRILRALIGESATEETRSRFEQRLNSGELENHTIEIEVHAPKNVPMMELPQGMQMGMINLGEMFKGLSERSKTKRVSVQEARKILMEEESDKLVDQEKNVREALDDVEQSGIVFIDEIDKICEESRHGKVSREGVQRDLLSLLEGSSVPTKHGTVKTDHIFFIASGAFHVSKPSDLLPELQGRLPIRVELSALTEKDFIRILTETESNLIRQYQALLSVEGVDLVFEPQAIEALARMAVEVNMQVENIGARRLHTVLERLLEDISFTAHHHRGEQIVIDEQKVTALLASLAKDPELSRFIL
jgi:ATP-dependent HslUV protease ATP-binding subunit HslU